MRVLNMTRLVVYALLLAGCAAPSAPRYYTLLPAFDGARAVAHTRADRVRVYSEDTKVAEAVQVLPVSLPADLDTTRLLVRTGPGKVVPLNNERWSGHLSEQIHAALSDRLAARLGLPSVQADAPVADASLWRVQVEIQRFESTPQGQAGLEAVWRLRHAKGSTPLCHTRVQRQSTTTDVAGLVLAHQANIDALAAQMVDTARAGRCVR